VLNLRRKITNEEYIERLKLIGIKLKKSSVYIGRSTEIIHICPTCGNDWMVRPNDILSGAKQCLDCSNNKKGSLMAIILKQVLKYYFPNTKHNYNYCSFIPELNILVEYKSEYQDSKKQKNMKDVYIKECENNYEYISVDHMELSPLQAIQLFFPWLTEMPSHLDISSFCIIPINTLEKVQELLNLKKYNYKQIAEIVGEGISHRSISRAISRKLLIRPNYKRKAPMDKLMKKVVQLKLDGTPVNEYNSLTSVVNEEFKKGSVNGACLGKYATKGHEYKNYLWYYKSEYDEMLNRYGKHSIAETIVRNQQGLMK
jgi:hypothetical protein